MTAEDPKGTAYYAALVDAWFTTRMVKDRTLLALSAGGVGLLVTLLTTRGVQSPCHLTAYVLAALSFLVAISSGVWIFHRNSAYLTRLIRAGSKAHELTEDDTLVALDKTLVGSFIVGVLLSILVAVMSAAPTEQENEVAKRKDVDINIKSSLPPDVLIKSFTGAGKIAPDPIADQAAQQATEGSGSTSTSTGTTPAAPVVSAPVKPTKNQ